MSGAVGSRGAGLGGGGPVVAVMDACRRDGRGGSPTAVVDETRPGGTALRDEQRRAVAGLAGTSHAVFVSALGDSAVRLRFFTGAGELPACGHGTVAALGFLAGRSGAADFRAVLRTAAGEFHGRAVRRGAEWAAAFETGPVEVRDPDRRPAPGRLDRVLHALGLAADPLAAAGSRIAALGRPRLLVPVSDRSRLATLSPNPAHLQEACDRLALLGCYVFHAPPDGSRVTARMFAPSIGVPEDVANANSTACLAALLAGTGRRTISVDMGDSLGTPSTITAEVRTEDDPAPPTTRTGSRAPWVHVGGSVALRRTFRLRPP
ncbi:PhzF family phenazine biosynthesis protein [Streptomyces sp. NRRL S-87]|uniref:PhzF family phenazine biosynthesis protein n=1 Tax=Streptomyces sp. NRRL S-87 TaxID=1463920 RepID=UPI00068AD1D5|nr:PhzF family phenazine biosynthesis isomerase [Streptomyces sp. NRRL S-87]